MCADEKDINWSYSGDTGPDRWGDLSAEFSLASRGKEQSPVEISGATPEKLPELKLDYIDCPVEVIDTGHLFFAHALDGEIAGGSLSIDGSSYTLKSFHFHCPAEHLIEGERYKAELHLVHKNQKGELLVLAVLFCPLKEGEVTHTLLNPTSPPERFNASLLLPTDTSKYYTYPGSLTTPPCTEGVKWVILKDVAAITEAQIEQLTDRYGANSRPTQPLNGRVVRISE
jgi:carbonic anhydrase